MSSLLDRINSPKDVKRLSAKELPLLAEEIRREIIETVSQTGGHLASNLGVVELTIALHYVFNAPYDKIIYDVGHQAYTHKLLTGRRDQFRSLRQYGGLSGFPCPAESDHDLFKVGHSGTSISMGLGINEAIKLAGSGEDVVCIIGDGSMTSGLAFEGLNQAGHLARRIIIILNDNEMSISSNVGALQSFISRKMSGARFTAFRRRLKLMLKGIPGIGEDVFYISKKLEDSLKGFITPGFLFEALGFEYFGPIDGHSFDELVETFQNVRHLGNPVLIHVVTKKGKGYDPAESDPSRYHGIGPFDLSSGNPLSKSAPVTYTKVFSNTICELGAKDEHIVAITAAMPSGTGLEEFAKQYPERTYDVGIAEQHGISFAAGLAKAGQKPVAAIYSTFLQRAYDQIIHDVCLQNLPVVFAIDRGGLVGADGPTHHGCFDLSYLRHIPNMTIMAPKDENELVHMIKTAIDHDGPVAVRYPRGRGRGVPMDDAPKALPIGRGEIMRQGKDVALIAIGPAVYTALDAADETAREGIDCAVFNARFAKPLDAEAICELAKNTGRLITIEENVLAGGFGSGVLELITDRGLTGVMVKRLGIPDKFIEHGDEKRLHEYCMLSPECLAQAIRESMSDSQEDKESKSESAEQDGQSED